MTQIIRERIRDLIRDDVGGEAPKVDDGLIDLFMAGLIGIKFDPKGKCLRYVATKELMKL